MIAALSIAAVDMYGVQGLKCSSFTSATLQRGSGRPVSGGGVIRRRVHSMTMTTSPTPLEIITKGIDRTQKAYPTELSVDPSSSTTDDFRTAAAAAKAQLASEASQALSIGPADIVASLLFGVVLWFGVLNDVLFPRASRPSDLVLPQLGKILGYSTEKDKWLADFESGSRGRYPNVVRFFGFAVFGAAGFLAQRLVRLVFTGPSDEAGAFTVQLAIIGCIWAGVYEIGRIDTGYALKSREENEELQRVWQDFITFADSRLEVTQESTSINQIEVVRAFRRFHGRHRTAEMEGSASDSVIIDMFRQWYRDSFGYARDFDGREVPLAPTPSSSGFFTGIKIKSSGVGV